jgi:hypothetical protein
MCSGSRANRKVGGAPHPFFYAKEIIGRARATAAFRLTRLKEK